MSRRSSITPWELECMLYDEMAEPKALPVSLLEEITDDFCDEQEIGRGGFAVVYKAKLQNRTVAVKRMSDEYMDEKVFHREVECLMMVKHKNVVRFLGYCADRQGSMEKYHGKFVMADVNQRFLCFEYLPKGSLDNYITDMSHGLRWRDRYQIITGICQGLHYLHQKKIVHLDLKPANILLDDNLEPKITDFGISRCFHEIQSRVITTIGGTLGYLAPESFNNTKITYQHSYQLDIYSLGVVITEIITGERGYHDVDNVVESWSNMLEKSHSDVQLKQVRVCAEIGVECIDSNPAKRPDTEHIINRLNDYIQTSMSTSQPAEDVSNELHQVMPSAPGQTSSEASSHLNRPENATAVEAEGFRSFPNKTEIDSADTLAGTNPYNSFWKNTYKPSTLNETMQSLNPDIRRCFQYCSVFPKGSKLRSDELVRLWIAQGFVKISCATEDIEDVAEGYIQELVSCSFLQPERTWHGTDFFTIHDMLHDMLDKVAGNCFRIENARSHRGDVWQGDVPRDVQHLFVQNYNAELITGRVLGLQNLLTLIICFVHEDIPVEEEVIKSIGTRLPKLRVLAIAFRKPDHEFGYPKNLPFPKSICQLKHLRYLALRTDWSYTVNLPSTLNKHQHIQVLDFGYGKLSEFTLGGLITLRHIICSSIVKFHSMGRLISLQTMPLLFIVRNEQGYGIKQLRDLNKVRPCLHILGLENVKTKEGALEANISAKDRLMELGLRWGYTHDARCSPEVEADVLEGLCPPMGLHTLKIERFEGSRCPDWMVGKQNGGPKNLQKLVLTECGKLGGPAPKLVEAFPHLHVLELTECGWDALPGNMEHLTSLKRLQIDLCFKIRSLPTLPQSLEVFRLAGCDDEFMKSCKTVGHPNGQKIEHIPEKYIDAILSKTEEPVATADPVATAPKQNKTLSWINRLRRF